jgi:hypothetical protein
MFQQQLWDLRPFLPRKHQLGTPGEAPDHEGFGRWAEPAQPITAPRSYDRALEGVTRVGEDEQDTIREPANHEGLITDVA